MTRIAVLALLASLFLRPVARADDASTPASDATDAVSYWNDIRPVFQVHCQGCHQPAKPSGEYVTTSFVAMLAGGESGETAVVPHDPDASYLMTQIVPDDGNAAMPQDQPPLSETQQDLIRRWSIRERPMIHPNRRAATSMRTIRPNMPPRPSSRRSGFRPTENILP